MEPSPTLDRRRVLAAGTATVFAGLAGCNDDDGGGRRSVDPGPPTSQAPANTSVLVRAEMDLLDHDGTEQLLDAYGDGAGGGDGSGGTGDSGGDGSQVGLVAEFEGRTGLAAGEADVIVVFADRPRGDFAAYVVDGAWTESTVVESIEAATGLEYEARDHQGGTVYEPNDGTAADALAFVAEGRYAVGSVGAVEAAIETTRADRGSVGGQLLEAFDDATESAAEGTTYVTAATDDPRAYLPSDDSERVPAAVSLDVYEKAEVGTIAYTAAASSVAIDAELRAPDESTAGEIADFTFVLKRGLASRVSDAVAAELSNVEVDQAESVVTITYRSDVEGAATLAGFL